MTRMPGALWIGPTPNRNPGRMISPLQGLVLHVQEGTEAGSEAWLRNPASRASAHFLNPKTGQLRQLVDTDDMAWAQASGNPHWISIENEGYSGDSLTGSQVENCAQVMAWISRTYGVPLTSTDSPTGRGLGWHGMGGAAWGGHPNCPGNPIKAQRPNILARARQLTGNPAPTAPAPAPAPAPKGYDIVGLPTLKQGSSGQQVRNLQGLLCAAGRTVSIDGQFGPATASTLHAWQSAAGLTADSICGAKSWGTLLGATVAP